MKRSISALMLTASLLTSAMNIHPSDSTAQKISSYKQLCKEHICKDYTLMFRDAPGGALVYPYITPGSQGYANVLWVM